ncbi:fimbrial protein [Orbus wheelerorum]|uniref:fimbrial protein n=1 Tax=Orbus wheelerorum TaxID=3074111 RepID=UPI00370DB677
MKIKNKGIAAFALTLLFTSMANAGDGTINFTGEIVAATCTVAGSSGSTVDVQLGKINKSALPAQGSTASATMFTIGLNSCDSSITKAQVSFDGTGDSTNQSLLAVTGGASGVAIGIYEADGTTQLPLFTKSKAITINNGAGAFNFVAKYVATNASIVVGKANSSATFSVAYQ